MKKLFTITAALCTAFTGVTAFTTSPLHATETAEYLQMLSPTTKSRGVGGTEATGTEKKELQVAMHLQFHLNSAQLTPEAESELRKLAAALDHETLRNYRFQIEGHTCDRGRAEYNLRLSKKRAEAVTRFLKENTSLTKEQFETSWYGESSPAVANVDEASRAQNRRVVIRNTLTTVASAQPASPEAAPLPPGEPATLQIIRSADNHPLADGETLKSGDHYSITFASADKPWAYVCQMDSSGRVDLLYPERAKIQVPVTLGKNYHLPQDGKQFFLDDTTGREQLVLLTFDRKVTDPLLVCRSELGSTVATRGVGGITSAEEAVLRNISEQAVETGICQINSQKKRGVGGIVSPDDTTATPVPAAEVKQSCSGYSLKRFFIHN